MLLLLDKGATTAAPGNGHEACARGVGGRQAREGGRRAFDARVHKHLMRTRCGARTRDHGIKGPALCLLS
jgi:hypothetical protein